MTATKFNKGDLIEWIAEPSPSGQHLGIVMNTEIPQEEDNWGVFVQWNDGDKEWERPSNLKLVVKAK